MESPIQQEENKLINLCLLSLKNEQNQINKKRNKKYLNMCHMLAKIIFLSYI